MGKKNEEEAKGLKGNPKRNRILHTLSRKMNPQDKWVQGPFDEKPRVRGNKAGRGRVYLPVGHVSRTHR